MITGQIRYELPLTQLHFKLAQDSLSQFTVSRRTIVLTRLALDQRRFRPSMAGGQSFEFDSTALTHVNAEGFIPKHQG